MWLIKSKVTIHHNGGRKSGLFTGEAIMMSTMYELTGTELDAVSGGVFDFGNEVTQANIAEQTGFNLLTVGGEVEQYLSQRNRSRIGGGVRFD
jgi:hypothetical protein